MAADPGFSSGVLVVKSKKSLIPRTAPVVVETFRNAFVVGNDVVFDVRLLVDGSNVDEKFDEKFDNENGDDDDSVDGNVVEGTGELREIFFNDGRMLSSSKSPTISVKFFTESNPGE